MTSQLNVDTIKGNETAGSITIQGEGSKTTNLQQGLCKVWADIDMTGTAAVDDSFNVTSMTDSGTGLPTITIANDFANIHYSMGVSGTNSSNGNAFVSMQGQTPTVTKYRLCGYITGGTNLDLSQCKSMCAGDLA